MDPNKLEVGFYYGYVEEPYGYMMVKYLGRKGRMYVFDVEFPKGPQIELTEEEVRSMVTET